MQPTCGYARLHHPPPNALTGLGARMRRCRPPLEEFLVRHGLLTSRQQKHDRRVARQLAWFQRVADFLNRHGGSPALQVVLADTRLRCALQPRPFKQSRPACGQARETTWVGLTVLADGQVAPWQASLAADGRPALDKACPPADQDESTQKALTAELRSLLVADALSDIGF